MDELKRNGFWFAMGLLAIAAIAVYFVVVAGIETEKASTERQIRKRLSKLKQYADLTEEEAADPEAGLPVSEIKKYWEDLSDMLDKERGGIEKIYRDKDSAFERLFTQSSRGEVVLATFVQELREQTKKQIEQKFSELLPKGTPFEKVFPIADPPPQDEREIRTAQKRFYIGRALAQAAKEADAETIEKLAFHFGASQGGDDDEEESTERRGISVRRIHTEFTLRIPLDKLPVLLSEILQEEIAVFTVDKVEVSKSPFSIASYAPWNLVDKMGASAGVTDVRHVADDVFVADCDQSDPESKDPPQQLPEPPVRVKLTVSVLDFDIPKPVSR